MDALFVLIESLLALLILLVLALGLDKKYPGGYWKFVYMLPLFVLFFLIAFSPHYRSDDYAAEFDEAFSQLRLRYVLAEEKEIDWDALYAEYRPKFAIAADKNDEYAAYRLWLQFSQEFYDGHTSFTLNNEDKAEAALCETFGNDYGLSLLRLADGSYAAVNVEGCGVSYSIDDKEQELPGAKAYLADGYEEKRLALKGAGLKNGSVITSWDGMPVEDLLKKVDVYLMSFPDRSNEEFYLPLHAVGYGGESVDIGFIDETGKEKMVKAPRLGAYAPRLMDSIMKLDAGMNISNLSFAQLSDDTVLLRIYSMAYDMASYEGADYSQMSAELREQLLTYREAGAERLILDLRANGGGSPFMVMAVAALLAPEGEHVADYTARINEKTALFERNEDGSYEINEALTYSGEDLWHDGEIIILVNAETVSAGDFMTYLLAEYPNVHVMGYTKTNSSCQAVSSISLSNGSLSFSAVPDIDEKGEPIIDTRSDRLSRVPVDELVPLDVEMIEQIFDEGGDPLLQKLLSLKEE